MASLWFLLRIVGLRLWIISANGVGPPNWKERESPFGTPRSRVLGIGSHIKKLQIR